MKYYNYFVAYSHISKQGNGTGMCQIFRREPISTYRDIVNTAELIKNTGFENIVIVNYVLLGEVDESELAARGG